MASASASPAPTSSVPTPSAASSASQTSLQQPQQLPKQQQQATSSLARGRGRGSGGSSRRLLDTLEGETALLSAIIFNRPVGLHKHFKMLAIIRNLETRFGCVFTNADVWHKLGTLYDLETLDEDVGVAVPSNSLLQRTQSVTSRWCWSGPAEHEPPSRTFVHLPSVDQNLLPTFHTTRPPTCKLQMRPTRSC